MEAFELTVLMGREGFFAWQQSDFLSVMSKYGEIINLWRDGDGYGRHKDRYIYVTIIGKDVIRKAIDDIKVNNDQGGIIIKAPACEDDVYAEEFTAILERWLKGKGAEVWLIWAD